MTKLITAGAVLVIAIVFGFIFWNQLSINQKQLAGENSAPVTTQNNNGSNTNAGAKLEVPKDDSISKISSDLDQIDTNIDSDAAQFDTELKGF